MLSGMLMLSMFVMDICRPADLANSQTWRFFTKKEKKPGDSVKNSKILAGCFFRNDKFKEQFK